VIDDEEWWGRFGGQLQANWEVERIRLYSSAILLACEIS
jgi:hypothetical protein